MTTCAVRSVSFAFAGASGLSQQLEEKLCLAKPSACAATMMDRKLTVERCGREAPEGIDLLITMDCMKPDARVARHFQDIISVSARTPDKGKDVGVLARSFDIDLRTIDGFNDHKTERLTGAPSEMPLNQHIDWKDQDTLGDMVADGLLSEFKRRGVESTAKNLYNDVGWHRRVMDLYLAYVEMAAHPHHWYAHP